MIVIIDTREQRPYIFDESISKKLDTGDYSIEGYENKICVERKSIDDYVQTLIRHRERFKKELARMQDFTYKCIVVECSLTDILEGNYISKVAPQSILGMTMSIMLRYNVPVLLCDDRTGGRIATEKFLKIALKRIEEL